MREMLVSLKDGRRSKSRRCTARGVPWGLQEWLWIQLAARRLDKVVLSKWEGPVSGKEPVRFGSRLCNNSSVRFGSVRTFIFPGSTRFGLRFSDVSWLGLVRFGSFPRPVPAGSRIKRFGSVRPVQFGFLFLPESAISLRHVERKDLNRSRFIKGGCSGNRV